MYENATGAGTRDLNVADPKFRECRRRREHAQGTSSRLAPRAKSLLTLINASSLTTRLACRRRGEVREVFLGKDVIWEEGRGGGQEGGAEEEGRRDSDGLLRDVNGSPAEIV